MSNFRLESGIAAAGTALAPDGFAGFAEATMTTDKRPKVAARDVALGWRTVRLVGATKGAGMIATAFVSASCSLFASGCRSSRCSRVAIALSVRWPS